MVLDQLTRSGLIVQADGDRLIISPKSKLTDEIRKYVKDHKQEIMDELRRPQVPPSHSETGSGQPTLPGEGETTLKTQNQGQSDRATGDSPLFGRLEAPILSQDCDSFTLTHPLSGEIVTLLSEWLISLEERSAILEHDGGFSKKEADDRAAAEFLRLFGKGEHSEKA